MTAPLLRMVGMSVELSAGMTQVDIVSDVDLELNRGERLGIVGESGSGKSMTALAVMGLLPQRMRVRGELMFDGRNLADLPEAEFCRYRGRRIAMIFQEPMTALNPVKSIGAQIAEGRRLHFGETRADAEKKARSLLDRVGLPAPRFNLDLYPHQLSGGQRQRVMIAMAIACEPDLLIADEPTTALDVTVQAQILDLLDDLIEDTGTALMLITHDLGVVSEMTDRIAVMYAGRVIETGRTDDVFARMAHPYARGLFAASPHGAALAPRQIGGRPRLNAIPGIVPDPFARPDHCSFAERCAFVQPDCRRAIPPLDLIDTDRNVEHRAACFHPRERMVAP
ncbi:MULTISPECIES: ABC transporter ATP-binding protein [unclassified Ensifer]|uniref:ABC transporter ATP-binding protein n=1 Tax=unclassified Ensifer TaxID=2633371 RepID=UPI00046D1B92|nr:MULTISPECIES: ABC transporter ATP-binding protein [unclassified Ensifer]MDP9629508.1 peptide/nickel transport system ATP-binding protein [Ensifer adhaerens]KQW50138.1 ABC transporter [Ensifer sp. Root1252]KRC74362.1 ABC transporter [Ensifer sp. Root231]KRD03075.1 ABC transporter [Ensifer sp. Root258]MBD9489400.1 ABC transporter ATP-binding protein [Ensifer sp. ENS11]